MLVVDASVAVAASHGPTGFARFGREQLLAPFLMTVEASSVLHEMTWRGEVEAGRGRRMLARILDAPIELVSPDGLVERAWATADDLGWAKTYDAHYVALAQMLGCRLVTLDERLIRGVARLGIAVRPTEL